MNKQQILKWSLHHGDVAGGSSSMSSPMTHSKKQLPRGSQVPHVGPDPYFKTKEGLRHVAISQLTTWCTYEDARTAYQAGDYTMACIAQKYSREKSRINRERLGIE